jgi:hypothetical protein
MGLTHRLDKNIIVQHIFCAVLISICCCMYVLQCKCPTLCVHTHTISFRPQSIFLLCLRTQHKISFEKKQLEPTKQSAKRASASTVGRCAIIAVSFPSSHFHARTFTAEKEKRETTRTESVHRPFFSFWDCVFSFVLFFFLPLNCTTLNIWTSVYMRRWSRGPYAYNVNV